MQQSLAGSPYLIRAAVPSDASILTEIAHAAKRHWGYREEWIREWASVLVITPELVRRTPVFLAEHSIDQGEPAGFCALLDRVDAWSLEHLWIQPRAMGSGLGRSLFDHAVRHIRWAHNESGRPLPVTLRIESDPNAVGFYERMGARRLGMVRADVAGERRALPYLEYAVAPNQSRSTPLAAAERQS